MKFALTKCVLLCLSVASCTCLLHSSVEDLPSAIVLTTLLVRDWIALTIDETSKVDSRVREAKARTSSATTAKPRP